MHSDYQDLFIYILDNLSRPEFVLVINPNELAFFYMLVIFLLIFGVFSTIFSRLPNSVIIATVISFTFMMGIKASPNFLELCIIVSTILGILFLFIDGILVGNSIKRNLLLSVLTIIVAAIASVLIGIHFRQQKIVGLFVIIASVVLITKRVQEIFADRPLSNPFSLTAIVALISVLAFVKVEGSYSVSAINQIERLIFPFGLATGIILPNEKK